MKKRKKNGEKPASQSVERENGENGVARQGIALSLTSWPLDPGPFHP